MPLQGSGQMSFADVYNEMTGESLANPTISISMSRHSFDNGAGEFGFIIFPERMDSESSETEYHPK